MKNRTQFFLKNLKSLWGDDNFIKNAKATATSFSRHRKMSLLECLIFLLTKEKTTIAFALHKFLPSLSHKTDRISSQAFSKARKHIVPQFLLDTLHELGQKFYQQKKSIKTWQTFRVLAIDGTSILLPNVRELKDTFGTIGCTQVQFPSVATQTSLMYDVLNHIPLDVVIGRAHENERKMATEHIDWLINHPTSHQNLLLFDRGYPDKSLMMKLIDAQQQFVFRLGKAHYKKEVATVSVDGSVTLEWEEKDFQIRIIKFIRPDGVEVTFATNIFSSTLLVEDFITLYALRWGIETNYNIMKNKLELINFSGRTKIAIEQEIYICCIQALLLHNLILDSDTKIQQNQKTKYTYKTNINHATGILFEYFRQLIFAKNISKILKHMFSIILYEKIPIKPNRYAPRRHRSRKTRHHANRKSNI